MSSVSSDPEPSIEPVARPLGRLPIGAEVLFADAPAIISVHRGPDHVYLYENLPGPSWGEPASPIGKPLAEAQPQMIGQGIIERFDQVYRTGRTLTVPELHMRWARPGEAPQDRWFKQTLRVWHEEDGSLGGVTSYAYEVTEQVEARRFAEESRTRLAFALEASGVVGTWDLRVEDDSVSFDERFAALFGLPSELVGTWVESAVVTGAVDDRDRDRVVAAIHAAAEAGDEYSEEYRVRGRDGVLRWVLARGKCFLGAEDRPTRFPGVAVDITQNKAAEAALRESERQLTQMIDGVAVLMALLDREGRVRYVNSTALATTPVPLSEMIGTPFETTPWWSETDGQPAAIRNLIEDAASGRTVRADMQYLADTGNGPTKRWVDLQISPVRDADGQVVALIPSGTDITERREAEEHRSLLISELNHRVKNTLAVVQSFAAQSFQHVEGGERAMVAFQGRLVGLSAAHDVLTRESWKGADLGEVVRESLQACGVEIGERALLSGPRVPLSAKSAVTFAMTIHELTTNAIKYGALSIKGGKVSVTWSVDDEAEPCLRVEWQEADGPPVSPTKRRGFGSRMIEQALTRELSGKAELRFEEAGLRCVIEAPLPKAEPAFRGISARRDAVQAAEPASSRSSPTIGTISRLSGDHVERQTP